MELHGEAYLFNLSLLAITFAAVSVLVMLIRQTMGGRLANFDVYLITTYIARGFVIAVAAILPSLIADFGLPSTMFWPAASGLAAVFFASVMATTQHQRSTITGGGLPRFLMFALTVHWISVLLLVANAAVPPLQGVGLFKAALTISLAMIMWTFVRRVASLVGDKPSEDWDPKRG